MSERPQFPPKRAVSSHRLTNTYRQSTFNLPISEWPSRFCLTFLSFVSMYKLTVMHEP
jgi:hypothetical protein